MKRIDTIAQIAVLLVLAAGLVPGQSEEPSPDAPYVIGPDDQLSVRVADMEEIGSVPQVVDMRGNISLPRLGRVHVAGLTPEQTEAVLEQRLGEYLQKPDVLVTVTQYHTQPVSVLGMVGTPGIQQIRGSKTLFEVISGAGGLKPEAGDTIKITRRKDMGALPLAKVVDDETGEYSVGEVAANDIVNATNPRANIEIKPHDIISVAKANLVYVIGAVKKPGGFILASNDNVTVLKAMALANGMERTATGKDVRILRLVEGSPTREEIHIDLKGIMNAKTADFPMKPDDILFIPTSNSRNVAVRALETIVSMGTGLAMYAAY